MSLQPLKHFVAMADKAFSEPYSPRERALALVPALKELVSNDNWLPASHAQPRSDFYAQYLLYCDPGERYSIVSFVWGPGQETPVHDHGVWGLIGMLRGTEISTRYRAMEGTFQATTADTLHPGEVDVLLPEEGDIHQVRNGQDDVSISIHVYGGNIGKIERRVFDVASGKAKAFVSGFTAAPTIQF